jgi:hypothetical protein
VTRGQGASAQKASAGLALFLEALTGFRRMRRADRATGRSPLPEENPFIGDSNGWLAWTLMPKLVFARKGLAPRARHSPEVPPFGSAHFNPL